MDTQSIVGEINQQIETLTRARDLLMGSTSGSTNGSSRNVVSIAASASPATNHRAITSPTTSRKSTMTPEGRKRIAEAMKERWAAKRALLAAPPAPTNKRATVKAIKK